MPTDLLIKEVESLSQEHKQEVYDFILFLKSKNDNNKKNKKRVLGIWDNEHFFMADDFDNTPDCFKEYV
ncbi:MAG: DUF2281 domain-containing protein [Lachnospiraceae bacterium]|jgi:hypothetical protein|nr:DUF2281 domain-containing protein [Lachnospiraceae bacterium]